jgi:hypothetical protein
MTHSRENRHAEQRQEQPRRLSAKRIKEKIDRAMLTTTFASTCVAVLAALAAVWTRWEAHEARLAEERPILRMNPVNYDEKRPLRTVVDDKVQEVAKSPAKNVRVACLTAIDEPPGSFRWDASSPVVYTFPAIFPDVWAVATCPIQ